MKKPIILIATLFIVTITNTLFAQSWNAPDANGNVILTNPNNNVIVGPLPTNPAQFHINNGTTSSNLNVTIENSSTVPGAVSGSTYLNFKGIGTNFSMGTSVFPACNSGGFHMSPTGTNGVGAGIHFWGGNRIAFSKNYSYGMCVYPSGPTSDYLFDGVVGSNGLQVNCNTFGYTLPSDQKMVVNGGGAIWGKLIVGGTSSTLYPGTHKLYVAGSIICEELVVKLQGSWSDYVFAPSYKLMPLSDVKKFITANSHLPEVPSACEIEKNGVATGDMLSIQMKKIEELTLYLIQMQEQNEVMQKTNASLQKRLEVLENK
jgi:hypothetical protein